MSNSHRPLERVLSRLAGVQSYNGYFMARCPGHDDSEPSLSVSEGKDGRALVHCFAGCSFEEIIAAAGLTAKDAFPGEPPSGSRREGEFTPSENGRYVDTPAGCTLREYAEHKRLPVEFLRKQHASEIPNYNGGPAVKMDYLDAEGAEVLCVRFRVSLDGKPKIKTRRRDKLCLYGLWHINKARAAGYAILAEGESDTQTGWYHGEPLVGVPGADTWKDDWANKFDGIERIYVIAEPDRGGQTLWDKLASSPLRERLYRVKLDGFKDLSEMHLDDPDRFEKRLRSALRSAEPWLKMAEAELAERVREAWEQCEELALKPRILDEFETDLKASGVAGDLLNAKLIFLALTTRLMNAKLLVNVIVKGPSGAGKTFLVMKVLGFFPEDAYYVLTAMSERALAYDDEPVSNRFIVIAEVAGMRGETLEYLVRSLLSEGEINYVTVTKGVEGLKPMRIHREGPTGLISTTTRLRVHHENETRVFSVQVDDSPDLTREILRTAAREDTEPPDLGRWHALQEWLAAGETRVTIPYSEALAEKVPPAAVRLRRDFTSILNLIRAHALLHRARRKRDGKGRIEATLEDYAVVRELVSKTISEGVGASVPEIVRETVQAVEDLSGDSEDDAVRIKAVATKLCLDYSATHRRVSLAIDGGYLRNLEDRPKRPAKLIVGDPLPEDGEILPAPEKLGDSEETGEPDVSTYLADSLGRATPPPSSVDGDPGVDF